jgi:hypothetical protein
VHELGYEPGDLAHLSLKLFQYMTSCKARRAAEHEDMTWWEFLQGEKFSPRCRAHMERGPEVLGAMTATESDVRTQGNMVTQFLIDQLVGRSVTDATLNGPTSLAWFDHWREYLVFRGVKFFRGMLVDFDLPDEDNPDHRPDVLLPRVAIAHHTLDPRSFTTAVRPHYFVLAAPVTAMMGRGEFVRANPELDPREDDFGACQAATSRPASWRVTPRSARASATRWSPRPPTVDDFVALQRWEAAIAAEDAASPTPRAAPGPCGTSAACSFSSPPTCSLARSTRSTWSRRGGCRPSRRCTSGTGGPPAPTAIAASSPSTWARCIARSDETFPAAKAPSPHATHAWNLPRATIAEEVFRDVADSIAVNTLAQRRAAAHHPPELFAKAFNPAVQGRCRRPQCPCPEGAAAVGPRRPRTRCAGPSRPSTRPLEPLCYHFDQNVTFAPDGKGGRAKPLALPHQPPAGVGARPGTLPPRSDTQRGYELQNARWVLAGTYMKTHTRLTTMEAANESARHAVNAILHDQQSLGDRCMIWDPEDFELPEFDDLKALDERLFRDGYPHMVEILGLDEIPWALVPGLLTPSPRSLTDEHRRLSQRAWWRWRHALGCAATHDDPLADLDLAALPHLLAAEPEVFRAPITAVAYLQAPTGWRQRVRLTVLMRADHPLSHLVPLNDAERARAFGCPRRLRAPRLPTGHRGPSWWST